MATSNIYIIEYYKENPQFHWTDTVRDKVLAKSETQATNKFKKKHPNIKTFTIVNVHYSDY